MKNKKLCNAKIAKKDEFYTQFNDVEKELKHYKRHFKNKTILCNCDDPAWSAFWRYFHLNFACLKLKRLISTHYNENSPTYAMIYDGEDDANISAGTKITLSGNGDFRNQECLDLLVGSDIVVTNPPFSLFREYIATLTQYDKKFIIWGNNNAITYKNVFELIKNNKLWLGYLANQTCVFRVGDGYEYNEKLTAVKNDGYRYGKVPAISVFTNLDIDKRHENIILQKNTLIKIILDMLIMTQ